MNRVNRLSLRLLSKRHFSTDPKVVISYQNDTCLMTLNNPKAFNAVNYEMFHLINEEISAWEDSNLYPRNLILKTDHPKAFSAGGDIMCLLDMYKADAPEEDMFRFFKFEFEVDLKLANLREKGVNTFALWDGIVMGGGVGISSGCKWRVACEKTLYAMPETRIGLFVDVAQSYYLNRLDNQLGRYLCLLGQRLKGKQATLAGVANAFLKQADLASLEEMIINRSTQDVDLYLQGSGQITSLPSEDALDWLAVNTLVVGVFARMNDDPRQLVSAHTQFLHELEGNTCQLADELKSLVDTWKLFPSVKTPEDLALLKDKVRNHLIANIKALGLQSPLSTLITDRNFVRSKGKSLREVFLSDFEMMKNVLNEREFFEGVDNLLVKKGKEQPNWMFATLDKVPEEIVQRLLAPSPSPVKLDL